MFVRILLLILLLCPSAMLFSQASDFITVKKRNNRTVKTFFPGLPIAFETIDKRQVSGWIEAIRNDSVFVKQWDIRPMINYLGIPITDTVAYYIDGFHYKEIAGVDVSGKTGSATLMPGRILIFGGTGYALLNVINGAYLHEPVTDSKNLKSLGIAAGAVGIGFLINYFVKHGNKYHVEYVHMNEVKKQLRGF